MLKKWLVFLLLFTMGLKNVSIACQPLASHAASNNHPGLFFYFIPENISGKESSASGILNYLLQLLDGNENSDYDLKLIDSEQKAFHQPGNFKIFRQQTLAPALLRHQQAAIIKTRQQTAVIKEYRLPAHYNYLFRLTPF